MKGRPFHGAQSFVGRTALLGITLLITALLTTVFLTAAADEKAAAGGGDGVTVDESVGDLNGNGIHETYTLENHRVTVREENEILWVSPEDYKVDCFVLADINNDGRTNLILSLWKHGSFGRNKPFWKKQQFAEDAEYKNHLFIYGFSGKELKQVWCSSNLVRPIVSFEVRDSDDDGLNELVVVEGQYKQENKNRYALDQNAPTSVCVFQWREWGFLAE